MVGETKRRKLNRATVASQTEIADGETLFSSERVLSAMQINFFVEIRFLHKYPDDSKILLR